MEGSISGTMKALIVGASKGFGKNLVDVLTAQGWTVATISRGGTFDVDWHDVDQAKLETFLKSLGTVNFVFFYQNFSALNSTSYSNDLTMPALWKLEKHWAQGHFVSSILPYHIIKTVKPKRAGWMLSSTSYQHSPDIIHHGDYVGNKYQNYVTMKNFSRIGQGCYFGLSPKQESDLDIPIGDLLEILLNGDINGKVLYMDGTPVEQFNIFEDNNGI